MPGPINALRFVHAAILTESSALEDRAQGDVSADDARALREDVETFERLMDGHTRGEEKGLFPKLAERESQLASTYLHDHEVEHQLFADFKSALGRVAAGKNGAARDVRALATAIRHHMHTHIAKENDLVLPYVEEHFEPAQQGEMLGQILSVFTPADMESMLPWIVSRLDDETASAYLGVLGKVQPPEVFAKSCDWIKAGIPDEQRARLAEQVEGLR